MVYTYCGWRTRGERAKDTNESSSHIPTTTIACLYPLRRKMCAYRTQTMRWKRNSSSKSTVLNQFIRMFFELPVLSKKRNTKSIKQEKKLCQRTSKWENLIQPNVCIWVYSKIYGQSGTVEFNFQYSVFLHIDRVRFSLNLTNSILVTSKQ